MVISKIALLFIRNNNIHSTDLIKKNSTFRVFIGVKKLLNLCDLARRLDQHNRVNKFLIEFEEEGGLMNSGPI